jgi:RHS repeat-associated protein
MRTTTRPSSARKKQVTRQLDTAIFTLSPAAAWVLQRKEDYSYDSSLDYLTQARYDDDGNGSWDVTNTWSYDAAGNRNDVTADNLNRVLTSTGGFVYEHDILGNRTWRNRLQSTGGVKYEWDVLNRLAKTVGTSSGGRYEYRADGMRTLKVTGFNLSWEWTDRTFTSGYYDEITAVNLPTTRYFYDGQMCMEEDVTYQQGGNAAIDVIRYGLGARGIDYMEKSVNGGTPGQFFPIYDGHGNNIGTISRGANNTFNLADRRAYDVWGSVRGGATTGDPNTRYCANLGHKQDDESTLIYMRARYYEPTTGRFVSEDKVRDGANWYIYAGNNPVTSLDNCGKSAASELMAWLGSILIFIGAGLAIKNTLQLLDVRKMVWQIKKELVHMQYVRQTADISMQELSKLVNLIEMSVNNMEVMTAVGVGKARAAAASYGLILLGYMIWAFSEFVDPYSPNMGLFGLFD